MKESAMTMEELAATLNGREYGKEITRDEERAAAAAGLVVAFGASDDLAEFRGALHDEFYPGEDGRIAVYSNGLGYDCGSDTITGVRYEWCPDGANVSWRVTPDVPFARFTVMEAGDVYCEGAVFKLADCPPPPDAKAILTILVERHKNVFPRDLMKLASKAIA